MANINLNFHSQLRSIIDTLALAAVKEISDLVDDGFAILRLEISHCQKENEALKNKLQIMELQIARGCEEESEMRELLANCRCGRIQNGDHPFQLFESHMDLARGSDEKPSVEDDDPLTQHSAISGECTEMEERRTDLALIKKERVEEDKDTLEEMNSREKRSLERRAGSREKCPIQETQNKAANHTEDLTEQHRTRHTVWEVSGLDSALKTEPETERAKSPQHTGCEQSAGRLHSSCPESLMCERTSRLRTLCTQGADETEAGAPSCSYAAESGCESLSIHSGLQSLPPTGNTAACSLSLGSVAVKPEAVMIDSAAAEEEAEVLSTWSTEPISENIVSQQRYSSEERPFICPQCGKLFAQLCHLRVHRRVHTGERPYRCPQCGQRFSHSGSLNRHFRVHTGEKPFRCTDCGRCFSESGNLRKHQRLHSRDRSFRCTSCKRMFSTVQNLKLHQLREHAPAFEMSFFKNVQ